MNIFKHSLFIQRTFLSTYYVSGTILGPVMTKEKGTVSMLKEAYPVQRWPCRQMWYRNIMVCFPKAFLSKRNGHWVNCAQIRNCKALVSKSKELRSISFFSFLSYRSFFSPNFTLQHHKAHHRSIVISGRKVQSQLSYSTRVPGIWDQFSSSRAIGKSAKES